MKIVKEKLLRYNSAALIPPHLNPLPYKGRGKGEGRQWDKDQ